MEFDRVQLKQYARINMRGKSPSVLPVSLLYLALTSGLSTVVSQLTFGPLAQILAAAQADGLNGQELIELIRTQGVDLAATLAVGGGLTLLTTLFCTILEFGYVTYTLELARGNSPGFGSLLTGFGHFGRVLGLNIMLAVFALLWTLAIFVPVALVCALAVMLLQSLEWLAAMLTSAAVSAGYVLLFARILRYAQALHALADDPSVGVFGAIERSKELMKGRRWEFFKLIFSFLGWYLLLYLVMFMAAYVGMMVVAVIALAGGGMGQAEELLAAMAGGSWVASAAMEVVSFLFMMWLTPYVGVTRAHFYLALSGSRTPAAEPPLPMGPGGGAPSGEDRPPESGDVWNRPDSRNDPDRPF